MLHRPALPGNPSPPVRSVISPFSDYSGFRSVVIHPTSDTVRPTLRKVKIPAGNPYIVQRIPVFSPVGAAISPERAP